MKIQSINISSDEMDNDLKDISLVKLTNLVLISGKNGAGKTRFLDSITGIAKVKSDYITTSKRHKNLIGRIKNNLDSQIENYENYVTTKPNDVGSINHLKKLKLQRQIAYSENQQDKFFTISNGEWTESSKIVNFVPQGLGWKDNRDQRESKNDSSIAQAHNPGSETAHDWICYYIRTIGDMYAAATNEKIRAGTKETRKESIQSFEALNEITESLLGQKFHFSEKGRAILFGEHILDAKLSSGQKVLLQLAVQIHAQSENLENVIILLDEPENHLHTEACIEFISKVRNVIPDNQLWISTHSIPILSNFFEESTLLFVKDGKVSYRGSAPEEVFKSLLGDEARVQKLRDFLGLPSEYAMLKYARECLLPPGVHLGDGNDAQGNQIYRKISEQNTEKKRILDFGAGKGRILLELNERSNSVQDEIDYVAYDKFPQDKDVCVDTINNIYSGDKPRYYNTLSEIPGNFENESFDLILMCNVLHEIEPSEWLGLFGENSPLSMLLKETGSLLVVEDEEIPIGEKAYKQGFIVFGKAELRILFKIPENETGFITDDERDNGRLMAHLIPKTYLTKVTPDSIRASLEAKNRRAKEEIERLRTEPASYKNGRKHGFWIQQYTNTSLALDTLR